MIEIGETISARVLELAMAPPKQKPSIFATDPARGPRMWSVDDGAYRPMREVGDRLPAGLYECGFDGRTVYLKRRTLQTDILVDLHDIVTDEIAKEIEDFWELPNRFAELGLVHKRGALLYGPQGTGKTALALRIAQRACEQNDAIAILIEEIGYATMALDAVRRVEPERRVVAILEDLDKLIEHNDESEILGLLDGERQVDNIVYLATTNNFDKLPPRISNRPSRFDIVRYISDLTPEARKSFLVTKDASMPEPVLTELVRRSDGYTIAHLKELLILVRAYGLPPEKAQARLSEMMKQDAESAPDA